MLAYFPRRDVEVTLKLIVKGNVTMPFKLHMRSERTPARSLLLPLVDERTPTTLHRTWEMGTMMDYKHDLRREISTILADNTPDYYDQVLRPSMPTWIVAITKQLKEWFKWVVGHAVILDYTLCRYPRPTFLDIPCDVSVCTSGEPDFVYENDFAIKRVLLSDEDDHDATTSATLADPENVELFETLLRWYLYEAFRGIDKTIRACEVVH